MALPNLSSSSQRFVMGISQLGQAPIATPLSQPGRSPHPCPSAFIRGSFRAFRGCPMSDVFTPAQRSQVTSRSRGKGNRDTELAPRQWRRASEFPEVECVAREAKVFDNVGDDAARHVARMPGERDEAVGVERIGVVPMAAGGAQEFAADFPQPALKLAAVPRGILAHGSGGEDEFVAERGRDGAAGFEQRLQVRLGRLLKAQGGFPAVASLRVAAGQEAGFGDPDPIFILPELHFGKWNDHDGATLSRPVTGVKRSLYA